MEKISERKKKEKKKETGTPLWFMAVYAPVAHIKG